MSNQPKPRVVCAWCKKDMGAASVGMDSTGAHVEGNPNSHSICPQCAAKLVSEAAEGDPGERNEGTVT